MTIPSCSPALSVSRETRWGPKGQEAFHQRKIYLFFGSDNGGKAAVVLTSVVASAKASHVEPQAYIRNLLETFAVEGEPELAKLLPDAWLCAHPEAKRRRPC